MAEACLDLQERRGCDVNILLFCCWLGASGRPTLTADGLRAILKASDAWQAGIVRPLRAVRRLLKDRPWPEALPEDRRCGAPPCGRCRAGGRACRADQACQPPFAAAPTATVRSSSALRAAVGNLGIYAVCLGVVPDSKDRDAVVALMKATFPMLAADEVTQAVRI